MGKIRKFCKRKRGLEDSSQEENKGVSADISFVSNEENEDYLESMTGKLLSQELDLDFISKHLPEEGRSLKEQAEILKKLLMLSNNEQDESVKESFKEYMDMFKKAYRRAEGLATIEKLKDLNQDLHKMFVRPTSQTGLNDKKLLEYIGAIKALQDKVDEADRNNDPILEGPSRQVFNDQSLEAEYRLKMLDILWLISECPYQTVVREMKENPFKKMTTAQKAKFPIMFKRDLDEICKDYNRLAFCEEIINKYSSNNFKDIDYYADELNVKINQQMMRDASFKKMFDGNLSNEELFEYIKKLVFMRYKLTEIERELPEVLERDRKAAEEEEQRQKEKELEEERQKAKRENDKRKRLELAEARRKARELEKQEAEKMVNATNEEIEEKLFELNRDLTKEGSRFVNIIDFQKRIAKAKGLLPTDDMVQSKNLVHKVFSKRDIVSFINKANEKGVNYIVFPNSQECSDGGFTVVVSKSDASILELKEESHGFYGKRDYIDRERSYVEKTYGKVPEYFVLKLAELIKNDDDGQKDNFKKMFYVEPTEDPEIFEIGIMKKWSESNVIKLDKYARKMIAKTYEELKNELKDDETCKDLLCYISLPATQNIIPLLEEFKNQGINPYFERVPEENERNSQNRDRIQIYFYRSDFDKFWNGIRPNLINPDGSNKIPFEIHYGKGFDFIKENEEDFHLKNIKDEKSNENRDDIE